MLNVGIFVEGITHTMTTEVTDDGITILNGMFITGITHISHSSPGSGGFHSQVQTLLGHLDQPALLLGDIPDAEHPGCIPVIPIINGGTVHIDNLTALQNPVLTGDPMADHLIDGDADGFRISLISQACRYASNLPGVILYQPVQFCCADAFLHVGSDIIENHGILFSRFPDSLNLLLRPDHGMIGNLVSPVSVICDPVVKGHMTLLIFLPAAAPTFIISADLHFEPP